MAGAAAAAPAVKLRRPILDKLTSEEGRRAAWFAKQLVTINMQLKAPPLWQPWDSFALRQPADGGQLAQQRAQQLNLHWTYARLQDMLRRWPSAPTAAAATSSSSGAVPAAPS
jgi:hypothetical protein